MGKKMELEKDGEEMLQACELCVWRCRVNRMEGEKGHCGGGILPKIYRYSVHYGEEPPVSGTEGSGTIFFTGCSLGCVYCQNHKWSQTKEGQDITIPDLAKVFMLLQDEKVHNINLVTPTHYIPQIAAAVRMARDMGLRIPVVYNTSGYESPKALAMLDGIVDIYLVDMKYSYNSLSERLSGVSNYVEVSREALKIMLEQVGQLVLTPEGIGKKGMIVRHLVIPGNVDSSIGVLDIIESICGNSAYISLMSQYLPLHTAAEHYGIDRKLESIEYQQVVEYFLEIGFSNGWVQELKEESDPDLIGENMEGNH